MQGIVTFLGFAFAIILPLAREARLARLEKERRFRRSRYTYSLRQ